MKLFIRTLVHAFYEFSPIILLTLALSMAHTGNREDSQMQDRAIHQEGHTERAGNNKNAAAMTASLPLQQTKQNERAHLN